MLTNKIINSQKLITTTLHKYIQIKNKHNIKIKIYILTLKQVYTYISFKIKGFSKK